ncbi:uncharacterized protein [Choristoneura fumiferana]|uniref:uncharacterized protein n=1 Tax=Choristoneura fumiferana TaxID=7141 RepID=UPI003D154805
MGRKRVKETPDREKKRRRRHIIYSSSEDEPEDPRPANAGAISDTSKTSATSSTATTVVASTSSTAPNTILTTTSLIDPVTTEQPTEPELDDAILQLLGDAPKTDVQLGPNVHKDIASRWQEILSNGLPKEVKEKLIKEYLIPGNCELLIPPILNAEIKAALPETLVKRDALLTEKQKQLGIALAALAKATHSMVIKDDHHKIIKAISDASRILCDTFFNETKTRRTFVISATNSKMKETLLDAKRDKYLFGENVAEKLKSAKSVQRSSVDLKQTQKNFNPKFAKNNFYKNKPLNTRALQRKTNGRPDAGRTRQAPAAAAAATPATAARTTRPYTTRSTQRQPPPPPRRY